VNDVTYSRNFVTGLKGKNYTFVSELLFVTKKIWGIVPGAEFKNSK